MAITVALPIARSASQQDCKLQEMAIDAALGDPLAQHNLGVAFHRGDVLTRDYSKAATMWRQSSKAGVLESCNNLGHLMYYGRGVTVDHAEGVRLWRIAAEKGFAESQIHLGEAYADGKYLKKDYVEAYAWAKAGKHYAAQIENERTREAIVKLGDQLLNELRGNLTEAETSKAVQRASEYIAKHGPK
jgi:hypothetical protein